MSARVSHTTIDCTDAFALSQWWKSVLGYVDVEGDPNGPGDEECMILDPDGGHRLLFVQLKDLDQSVKNRIHLDLRPRAGTREEELARLLALGARQHADHRGIHGPDTGWVVLADPEDNLFCILRHESEYGPDSSGTGLPTQQQFS